MQQHPLRTPRRRSRASRSHATPTTPTALTTPTAHTVHRCIRIAEFSRAAHSGVWYYRVDIAVYRDTTASCCGSSFDSSESLSGDESDDGADDDASLRCSTDLSAVQSYSVLRRYSDFLHLHADVKQYLAEVVPQSDYALPPFPEKELLSPALVGLLWRLSSSRHVLEERRSKFEALLQFIEDHAVARCCPAFESFLGQPPQRQDGGYVSLKEYTSPSWFASLKQLTHAKKQQQRERYYTMDAEHLAALVDNSHANAASAHARLHKRRRRARPSSASTAASSSASLLVLPDALVPSQTHVTVLSAARDAAPVDSTCSVIKSAESLQYAEETPLRVATAAS